jgi:hypothetical protein
MCKVFSKDSMVILAWIYKELIVQISKMIITRGKKAGRERNWMSPGSNGANHRTRRDLLALTLAEGLLDTGVGLLSLNRVTRRSKRDPFAISSPACSTDHESPWSSTGGKYIVRTRIKALLSGGVYAHELDLEIQCFVCKVTAIRIIWIGIPLARWNHGDLHFPCLHSQKPV